MDILSRHPRIEKIHHTHSAFFFALLIAPTALLPRIPVDTILCPQPRHEKKKKINMCLSLKSLSAPLQIPECCLPPNSLSILPQSSTHSQSFNNGFHEQHHYQRQWRDAQNLCIEFDHSRCCLQYRRIFCLHSSFRRRRIFLVPTPS